MNRSHLNIRLVEMIFVQSKINFFFLCFAIFALIFTSSCKEEENPYIPTPDLFIRNFTENIPKKSEMESELREILNTGTLFCEHSFQDRKVEINGINENLFIHDSEQFSASTILSVYLQKIRNKKDIFVLKSRCCPMGPCYTSYFFQKQQSGEWKLFDTIPGEIIDYKKKKDITIIKIQDNSMTGLIFLGQWKDKSFDPLLIYRNFNVEIPLKFNLVKKQLNEDKEINLLKKPKDYHIDNLAIRFIANSGSNLYILSETESHYFIMVKANAKQHENVLGDFQAERGNLVGEIQGLSENIKKLRDLEKLLNKTFYNIGWIEKF